MRNDFFIRSALQLIFLLVSLVILHFFNTLPPNQFDPETLNQVNAWAGGSNAAAPGLTSAQNQNGNGKVYPMNRNFVFGLDFTF